MLEENPAGPKRKIWIIGIVLLICIIIVVFVLFLTSKKEYDCDEIEEETIKDYCESCEKLGNPEGCRNILYMNLAVFSEDESICKQITEEDRKKTCLSIVVSKKALEKDDESVCESLNGDVMTNCKDLFFYEKGGENKELCAKISDESLRNFCLGAVAPSPGNSDVIPIP